ncbi:hypothetical protein FRX31_015504, partial [Thalictrum thalictroides]
MVEQTITERDWINLRFPDQRFIEGVNTFVKFVQDHYPSEDTTQCPCNLCKNQRIPILYEEVKIDLYKNGFNPSYKIWYLHGESEPREQIDCMQGFQNEHEDIFMDDFDEVLLNSMAQDPGGNPDAFTQDKPNPIPQGEEKLNEDAQMKFDNLPHYLEALYPGCEHNVLNFTRRLLNLKDEGRHKKFLESRKIAAGKKSGYYKVLPEEEFIPWLKQQKEIIESTDAIFLDIIRGPMSIATRYKKYCINGFLFVTKDYEQNKRYQNSRVSTNCITTFRSIAKDISPVDEPTTYYGVLKDIIQLEYRGGYKQILFKSDWVKVTGNGVRWDEEANLRLVFYSKDPKDPEWHVVLEVPSKVYFEDRTCLLRSESVDTDVDEGPESSELVMVDELIFNEDDNIE